MTAVLLDCSIPQFQSLQCAALPPTPFAVSKITAANAADGGALHRAIAGFTAMVEREKGYAAACDISNPQFNPAPGELFFVVGPGPELPLAYAQGTVYRSLEDFARGVSPRGAANSRQGFRDESGCVISPEGLSAARGFRSYRGGEVYHLEGLQVLLPGCGALVLDHIKREGFGLIITEADNAEEAQLFRRSGFVPSGLKWSSPHTVWIAEAALPVMIWSGASTAALRAAVPAV